MKQALICKWGGGIVTDTTISASTAGLRHQDPTACRCWMDPECRSYRPSKCGKHRRSCKETARLTISRPGFQATMSMSLSSLKASL